MKIIKIIIPCLLLNACMFGTSKNAKFYTMTATPGSAISIDYNAFVGVNRVQLPKYVDRTQIITQYKDSTQIKISEYNRWVESPATLVTHVLTEDLSVLLPLAQIKENRFKKRETDCVITVEIIEMNGVLGQKAELTAWYTVQDGAGKVKTYQKFSSSVSIGKTYDELAQGYSQLLMMLSQEIAASLIAK